VFPGLRLWEGRGRRRESWTWALEGGMFPGLRLCEEACFLDLGCGRRHVSWT
jgi:hypothetical protein